MELGLTLGDTSRPLSFMEEPREASNQYGLGFNTILSIGPVMSTKQTNHQQQEQELQTVERNKHKSEEKHEAENGSLLSPSLKDNNKVVQPLDLPPPHLFFPLHPSLENSTKSHFSYGGSLRSLNLNMPAEEEAALPWSPNSAASSGEGSYDQRIYRGNTRKKLRLSKEQYAFLEESFKDRRTLNPKQKIALAKQLHLRPRQVEVWFQNRRARTKLKKIELDYEHLKRCCDALTEENRRLQKELQELKTLKTSSPFYMQLPTTMLTMYPEDAMAQNH